MRWAIDSLVALMIAGVIAGIVMHVRQGEQAEIDKEVVRGDVQRGHRLGRAPRDRSQARASQKVLA